VPTKAHLLAPVEQLDFFDTQSVVLPGKIKAIEAWNIIKSRPMPLMGLAFKVRDGISSIFGVKPIGGFSRGAIVAPKVGDQVDFFLLEHISNDIVTLSVRDKHLDVMTCICVDEKTVSITSSVVTHNIFGRAYMIPVAPAHRLIINKSLSGLYKNQMNLPGSA